MCHTHVGSFSSQRQVSSEDAENPGADDANTSGREVEPEWQAESALDYTCNSCAERRGDRQTFKWERSFFLAETEGLYTLSAHF